jgi:hypothetical protein
VIDAGEHGYALTKSGERLGDILMDLHRWSESALK